MRVCVRVRAGASSGDVVRLDGNLAGVYLSERDDDLVFKLRCCPAFDDVPSLMRAGCGVYVLDFGAEVHVPLRLAAGLCRSHANFSIRQ